MSELPEVTAFQDYIDHNCLNKKIVDVKAATKSLIKK